MNVLIVYDSVYGNTERIARAIFGTLDGAHGGARLLKAEEAATLVGQPCDLLIVGGPTQRHAASPAMRAFFENVPRGTYKGTQAAAFDTRYRMSAFLTGSAAEWIAGRLKRAGAALAVPPESFFIARDVPPEGEKRRHELEHLEHGEEQRASAWAVTILARMASEREPAGAG